MQRIKLTTVISKAPNILRFLCAPCCLLLFFPWCDLAFAQAQGNTEESNSHTGVVLQQADDSEAVLRSLVMQLDAPTYQAREQAQRRLVAMGQKVLVRLKRLAETEPFTGLEPRARLVAIISRIENSDLQQRLDKFLFENDPTKDYGLEAWSRFREIAGNSRSSKRMMIEMYRCWPDVLNASVGDQETFRDLTLGCVAKLRTRLFSLEGLSMGDGLTLLYCVGQFPEDIPVDAEDLTLRALATVPISPQFDNDRWKPPLHNLVSHWLGSKDVANVENALYLCNSYEIAVCRSLALRTLKKPSKLSNDAFRLALESLVRFGELQDILVIEPFLEDQTVGSPSDDFELEVLRCDIALSAIVRIAKLPHQLFFPAERFSSQTMRDFAESRRFRESWLGFSKTNPADRQASLEHWAQKRDSILSDVREDSGLDDDLLQNAESSPTSQPARNKQEGS